MIKRVHIETRGAIQIGNVPPIDMVKERHDYFASISDVGNYMFHGSQRGGISELVTQRESTDTTTFGKREQVFATPDIFWAMWFALLDRRQIKLTSNGCYIDREAHLSYYEFAIDADSFHINSQPLERGWIYILKADTFTEQNTESAYEGFYLAEYGSQVSVRPVAAIEVYPSDFPYEQYIQPYRET